MRLSKIILFHIPSGCCTEPNIQIHFLLHSDQQSNYNKVKDSIKDEILFLALNLVCPWLIHRLFFLHTYSLLEFVAWSPYSTSIKWKNQLRIRKNHNERTMQFRIKEWRKVYMRRWLFRTRECHRARMRLKSCLRKLLSANSVLKLQFSPQLLLLFTQRKRCGQGVILEERDRAGSEEENNSLSFSPYSSSVNLEDWK